MLVGKNFNLLSEPWILLSSGEEVGLIDLFQRHEGYIQLGGNAIEKISMFKLLLAISQASTFVSLSEFKKINNERFSKRVCEYLTNNAEKFDLYCSEKPFLQYPSLKRAKKASFKALSPYLVEPTTNSLVTSHSQLIDEDLITDAMLARMLVQQMSFSLAGKKVDREFFFPGDVGVASAPAGPGLLFFGALHSYVATSNIVETLRLSLFQFECFDGRKLAPGQVDLSSLYKKGSGINMAPWDELPPNASGEYASNYKQTLMGRLIPISRFCLIDPEDKSFHFAAGLDHKNYLEGMYDPTHIAFPDLPKPKLLWCDTDKKPCRYFPHIFSYLGEISKESSRSLQVQQSLNNMKIFEIDSAKLVLAGLQCGSSTGETVINSKNDYVYSEVNIDPTQIGEYWYARMRSIWDEFDSCSKRLYGVTSGYFESIQVVGVLRDSAIERTSNMFWRGAEMIINYSIGKIDNSSDVSPDEIEFTRHIEKNLIDVAVKSLSLIKPQNGKYLPEYLKAEFFLKLYKSENGNDKSEVVA